MSLIDPALRKDGRASTTPPTTLFVVLAIVTLLGAGFGGFALSYGAVSVQELGIPAPGFISTGRIAALIIPVLVLFFWLPASVRRLDVGVFYFLSAVVLGLGVGGLLGIQLAPNRDNGIGITFALSMMGVGWGIAFLLVAILAARRRVKTAKLLRETGVRTIGTVSDQGYTHWGESGNLIVGVTFSFVDTAGNKRWVKRQMNVRSSNPVVNGQTTHIWYDPANPAKKSTIVVELAQKHGSIKL